jgi:hypothetical protein
LDDKYFLEKHVRFIDTDDKELEEIKSYLVELNRIFTEASDTVRVGGSGKKLFNNRNNLQTLKKDAVSNFFIVPIERLMYWNGERKETVGLCLNVYTMIKKKQKYKCITIRLKDEELEKGGWITPSRLDYDYILFDKQYQHLKRSIMIAVRMLDEDDESVFLENIGWVDNFSGSRYIFEGRYYSISHELQGIVTKPIDILEENAFIFLSTIKELLDGEFKLLQYSKEYEDKDTVLNLIGWVDEEKWYLLYDRTWELAQKLIAKNKSSLTVEQKKLDEYLYNQEFIKGNKEKSKGKNDSERIRADYNVTVYPKKKERVLCIDKIKINEFLQYMNQRKVELEQKDNDCD